MPIMLEDLTALPPKRLERRLEELWSEALPCRAALPWEASPERGLTVCLYVDSLGRRDVTDLGRVAESEPGGWATLAWSSLSPNRRTPHWRLLLHVDIERPVRCAFSVGFDVGIGDRDAMRTSLPLLLSARFVCFTFDGMPSSWQPLPVFSAPTAITPVKDALIGTAQ